MQVDELRRIRNTIDVALFPQMPTLGSHVTDLDYGLEAEFPLDANRIVVDCRRVKFRINGFQRCRSNERAVNESSYLVNIAKIDP